MAGEAQAGPPCGGHRDAQLLLAGKVLGLGPGDWQVRAAFQKKIPGLLSAQSPESVQTQMDEMMCQSHPWILSDLLGHTHVPMTISTELFDNRLHSPVLEALGW